MKFTVSLIFFTSLLVVSICYAQPPAGSGKDGNNPSIGILRGEVLDEKTHSPLPYSNVVLYRERDSTMVNGTIAGGDGSFILEKIPYGIYYLEVKFIGFDKKNIREIRMTPENTIIDLGEIVLKEGVEQLQEVEVTAERSPVEYHIDKKVVHVSENLNAIGGNAAEALVNVPSITVDVEGNVSLRGSSSYTVLIDGKPSPLDGSDALRQIPASAVENIEIITNPSAKYDPDGLAGIINVITKKRALDGFSGLVNASVGTGDKYRGDFLISYKNDKLSAFFGADYTNETRSGEIEVSQMSIMNDTSYYIDHSGKGPFTRSGYAIKGGIGYKFNDNNSILIDGSYGYSEFSRSSSENFKEYSIPSAFESYYVQNEGDTRYEDFYTLSLNYEKVFNNKDHKLTSYIYYTQEWGGANENIDRHITNEDWEVIDNDPYRIYIDEPGKEYELRFQSDYTRPIGIDGRLEAGYQIRSEKEIESYFFSEWDSDLNDWVNNSDFSNSLDFTRNIQALYAMYADNVLGFDYQFGLRGEYTYRSVQNIKSEQPSELDRFDYFPSAHISRKIGKQDQAQISYSRRIRRPRGFQLDPFINYMDPNTIRVGNPELLPEYTDSYEIAYQKGLGKSFISLEGYYRLTHDAMTRVTDVLEDGTRVLTMENLNEEHAMGAELMLNFLINQWFNFNISGNVYKYKLNGTISEIGVSHSSANYDSRFNLNFRITPTTRLQFQGFYQGPSVTAQGRREDFLMTSAAVKQDFFKGKVSATLQIQDIFGTSNFNFVNEGPGFYDTIYRTRESQVVRLTLAFRINNYKKQNSEKGEGFDNWNGMDQEIGY
jgi:outer membrane receptor protein involved in Fe transport